MKVIQELKIEDDVNVFIVGDIHGMYDLLILKLKSINFNFNKDILISVGDLVDRGEKNIQSFRLLDNHWFKAIRGNHEQLCIDGVSDNYMARVHISNGGLWFYSLPEQDQEHIARRFLSLPILLEVEYKNKKFGFIHADPPLLDWLSIKKAVEQNLKINGRMIREECIWSRNTVYKDTTHINNIDNVFLGHTILKEPKQVGNCTFLDTGAFLHNTIDSLTILNLNDYV